MQTVLVVDDEFGVAEVLQSILEDEGYRVVTAINGKQALTRLGQASQACKAYAELEAVYGSTMRADLQKMLPDAKAQAKCRG